MKYNFERDGEELIHLPATLDGREDMLMLFDTGASHTCFDKTDFIMAGYSIDWPVKSITVQTAMGNMDVGWLDFSN